MGTFLNAVKNLINSLTAKTSSTASTADMVQLHDANGNPNGKISLADLASVLGGPGILAEVISLRVNEVSSGDADVFTKGIYYTGNPQLISNMPSGLISNPTVIIYIGKSGGSDRGIQICISANRNSGAMMAARALLYSGWTAWEEVNKT